MNKEMLILIPERTVVLLRQGVTAQHSVQHCVVKSVSDSVKETSCVLLQRLRLAKQTRWPSVLMTAVLTELIK